MQFFDCILLFTSIFFQLIRRYLQHLIKVIDDILGLTINKFVYFGYIYQSVEIGS